MEQVNFSKKKRIALMVCAVIAAFIAVPLLATYFSPYNAQAGSGPIGGRPAASDPAAAPTIAVPETAKKALTAVAARQARRLAAVTTQALAKSDQGTNSSSGSGSNGAGNGQTGNGTNASAGGTSGGGNAGGNGNGNGSDVNGNGNGNAGGNNAGGNGNGLGQLTKLPENSAEIGGAFGNFWKLAWQMAWPMIKQLTARFWVALQPVWNTFQQASKEAGLNLNMATDLNLNAAAPVNAAP